MDGHPPKGRKSPGESEWRVDRSASRERLRDYDPAPAGTDRAAGGALIYTDEQGAQRCLPGLGQLTTGEVGAAARATSYELGAVDPSYAKLAAIERLNELRSAGAVSEENYLKEKRRILRK